MKLPNSIRLRVFPLLLALASATPAFATYVTGTQKPRKRDASAHDGASCNLDD
ncbi:MAG TPA: hypothetical protein VHQ02_00940 [Usitatibacter sp.]|jgi:hypothetical protein|nr:hypothetical protein [Usitatibacter sp.]